MRKIVAVAIVALAVAAGASAFGAPPTRTLDGSGNNVRNPSWGQTNTQYLRVADANYADGVGQPVSGPSPRYVSSRVFNDEGQNLFSETGETQWGWAWGQFLDHTFGLADETPAESLPIPFDKHDPLEEFQDDLGAIDFTRTPAAPGTATIRHNPRQQINTVSSYIDAFSVYGGTDARLEWLRTGPVDGNLANNGPTLLLDSKGYLPRADARGNAATAPHMDLMGALVGTPAKAVEAGDVRANENIGLTSIHTLFAREHNRIVGLLPSYLSAEDKFQIARRVVGAEEQYITYNEFLPSLGVRLDPYRGYDPNVNASLSNEFATTGYRVHSMVHGEFDVTAVAGTYSAAQLAAFAAEGIAVDTTAADGSVDLTIPLTLAFGNPDLLEQVGEGAILAALAGEAQYKNDEQIDNSMRSVLLQIPKPGATQPCSTPVIDPTCFTDVSDLGAIDVQRGRDHGIPYYNDLRRAYGLRPKRSFTDITGESTDQFPAGLTINTPGILDFVKLFDRNGNPVVLGNDAAQEDAVVGVRKTTLAARLKAIYGDVDKVDAFVGMVSEKHVPGTEFGELQLAMWTKQFAALRDGDRFFYANDPELDRIQHAYSINFKVTLSQLIKLDAGVTLQANVFKLADLNQPAPHEKRLHGHRRGHPPYAFGPPGRH